ncbi:Granzyme B(G,H) [Trichinella pseudospiralis]|uniref:Granzyme B(G,H) n=1 Tax=Trichinella pseudospiralis TaxID=6337 RepID=A0A0V1G488_TRIPS|nr:Granzyme B(G,H) [Trichinella pseudospiralis]
MSRRLEKGNKIAGGWNAAPHSIPYQVKLYIEKRSGANGCGGVIIQLKEGNGTDVILTAAHCVHDATGAHDLESHFEESQRKIPVKNFVIHPDYNPKTLVADIALLKLKEKIPYTDKTRPACLPNKDDEPITNELCYASGWGAHYSGGDGDTVLKMAVLPIQPSEKCHLAGGIATRFCAGGVSGGHGICQGDSGGPLACERNGRLAGKVTEPFPCGLSAFPMKKEESSSNRVTNGWETRPNSVPYQVKLIVTKSDNQAGCGGTLIQFKPGNGTTLILTAAHCIYDSNRRKVLEPQKIEALVGAHNVYKLDEETRKQVLVKTYGNPSAILQVAKVDVWADEKCIVNATSSICIGGRKDGRGGCQGDSGGPLLCEHNKRMVVFGVSSGNTGLCGQFNKPSVYTRVTFYLDWLKENSKNSGDVSGSASSTAGSSAISKPNKVKDDFADGASDKMNFSPKVSNVPSQPAFPGSRFMSPLPSPGRTATSRFYTPPSSSGLSRSRFQTI